MCPPETVKINFAGQDVDLSQYRRGVPVKFELSVTGE
jgi:cytoskeleton protein RodZ